MEEYNNVQRLGANRNDMYWIVYQTTNLVNNKIYIGVHKTKTPYVFDGYLGCGVYKGSPKSYEGCHTKFECAVKKYGPSNFKRTVLKVFDNELEAYEEEAHLVDKKFLARSDVYNMILGGSISNTTKKTTKICQYDLSGNYIKGYRSFQNAAKAVKGLASELSVACKYKLTFKGFLWCKEKVIKLDITEYTIPNDTHTKKPIYMYSKDGEFLQEFPSTRATGYTQASQAAILGMLVDLKYYFCYIKADSYSKARDEYVKNRIIYQYDSNGNFLKAWKYLEALKVFKGDNINMAIRHKRLTASGFYWGLQKYPVYNQPIVKSSRKIGKYDLNDNLIKEYKNTSECYRENGNSVYRVLQGWRITYKGFKYKYIS